MFSKKTTPKGADTKSAVPAAKTEAKPAAAAKPEKKGLFGFGKKKAATAPAAKPAAGAPAAAAAKPATAAPGAKPAAKPKAKKGGSPLTLLLPLVLVVALVGGGYYAYTHFFAGGGTENAPAAPAPAAAAAQPLTDAQKSLTDTDAASGAKPVKKQAKRCGGTPKFFAKLKLPASATFSTNEPKTRGLVALAPIENSDAVSKYQHQSWNTAGFMDAFVIDQNGNVYVAPSPRTGLGVSKPTKQDHLYKLDTNSGQLKDMLALPSAAQTSPENPYGILGLALDCDTNSLYATTVTGSADADQVGRIYRIDLATGELAGQLDNLDGYGVAVRTTTNGKQLVFGSARDGVLRAVDLDAAGNFQGAPREIAALDGLKRARRISFPNENGMVVQAVEFTFANTNLPKGTNVNFQYDAAGDKWSLVQ